MPCLNVAKFRSTIASKSILFVLFSVFKLRHIKRAVIMRSSAFAKFVGALLCLSLALLQPTTLCALLYTVWRYYNHLSSVLCLSILQPTIRRSTLPVDIQLTIWSTDYPLCTLLRYPNRPSAVIFSVWRYYNRVSALLCLLILQSTIRSTTLPVDITTDYPL
jgi:hypothetical protein